MNLFIPAEALSILEGLANCGYEAYLVGGCVRDGVMGKRPNDWDVCTNALPRQVLEVFSQYKTAETGLAHGTVTALIDGLPIEITTFRSDGEYSDNRRPDTVTFSKSLYDDLSRRDFTINAMAYSPQSGLEDPFGGKTDIEAGVIRCVGDPFIRLSEDALRICRALRFSAVLGFAIEEKTRAALFEKKGLLKNIAAERIGAEFKALLSGVNAGEVLARYREVLSVFLPPLPEGWEDRCAELSSLEDSLPLRFAALFKGTDFKELGGKLKLPSRLIKEAELLSKYIGCDTSDEYDIRKMIGELGAQNALLAVKNKAAVSEIIARGEPCRIADLAITGRELTRLGLTGRQVGEVLDALLELIMKNKIENNSQVLLNKVKEMVL